MCHSTKAPARIAHRRSGLRSERCSRRNSRVSIPADGEQRILLSLACTTSTDAEERLDEDTRGDTPDVLGFSDTMSISSHGIFF